jgi:hypothetical protein
MKKMCANGATDKFFIAKCDRNATDATDWTHRTEVMFVEDGVDGLAGEGRLRGRKAFSHCKKEMGQLDIVRGSGGRGHGDGDRLETSTWRGGLHERTRSVRPRQLR